ncbi:MAG: GNAT family N-acetyltransferase [Ilumatobacteraceae bacterium]
MLRAVALETARLVLTPLVATDAEVMVDVLGDEQMHEFTGGHPLSLEELRSRYRRLEVGRSPDGDEAWMNWVVRLGDDLRPVGVMQATVAADRSSADVAWEIGVTLQGNGFASEAASAVVDWLIARGVAEVRACIHPEHVASTTVASRAGLSPTDEWVDGEVVWRRTET